MRFCFFLIIEKRCVFILVVQGVLYPPSLSGPTTKKRIRVNVEGGGGQPSIRNQLGFFFKQKNSEWVETEK